MLSKQCLLQPVLGSARSFQTGKSLWRAERSWTIFLIDQQWRDIAMGSKKKHTNKPKIIFSVNLFLSCGVSSFVNYCDHLCWDFMFPDGILGSLHIFSKEHVRSEISEKKKKWKAAGSNPLWQMSLHRVTWLKHKHDLKFPPKIFFIVQSSSHCEFRGCLC